MLGALFTVGLALQLQLGARLQSDGFYYFAYLRSLAFDHDVDFMNDYRMLGLGDKTYLFQPTRTGHAESAWTIGPAIVWSPFFAAGHVVATRLHAKGLDVSDRRHVVSLPAGGLRRQSLLRPARMLVRLPVRADFLPRVDCRRPPSR